MNFNEFRNAVISNYNKRFNSSLCECYIFRGLGRMLCINFRLAESARECASGIIGNDCFSISFTVFLPDDFDEEKNDLPETMVLESRFTSYATKPDNKYTYCSYKKIPFRKTKGNAEKIINTLNKYTIKLYDSVLDDYKNNNLLERDAELVRRKAYKKGVD